MADMKSFIAKAAARQQLTRTEAEDAFGIIMSGEATPSQIGGFLMALRVRGETVEEIAGAVAAMRAKMTRVEAPAGAIDIVGTGGDGKGTLNISTAAALVVAGCGVPVAKHGNRNLSSKSGAADALTELGVNVMVGPEVVERALAEAGIGFMMAPVHHPATRHVMPARQELGTRTIFNILGPLTNPASVRRQLSGAFSRAEMVRKLEAAFAGWPGPRPQVPPVPSEIATAPPGLYRIQKGIPQGRVSIGLPHGRILAKADPAGAGPDVTWECAFADEAAHARDLAARDGSAAFAAVRARMTAAIDRFERLIQRRFLPTPPVATFPGVQVRRLSGR